MQDDGYVSSHFILFFYTVFACMCLSAGRDAIFIHMIRALQPKVLSFLMTE